MGLTELLEQIRREYIEQLYAIIDEKNMVSDQRVIPEPALRGEDGRLALEGELELPSRTDIAVLQGDDLLEMFNIEPGKPLPFDAVEFDWGKTLHVDMGPFSWQAFGVAMPRDEGYVWAPLQDWYWKWFHEEDDSDSAELMGAVHYLSDPAIEGDIVQFSIDLGSAPIAAFEELLDAISASGVSLCAIGQVPSVEA
jgi:hypothetical protein